MFTIKKLALGLGVVAALVASAQQADAARGTLGIVIQQYGYSGVQVTRVVPGTPAWFSGIRPGWRLARVGGFPVYNMGMAYKAKALAPDNVYIPFQFQTPFGNYVTLYATFAGGGPVVYTPKPTGPVYYMKKTPTGGMQYYKAKP